MLTRAVAPEMTNDPNGRLSPVGAAGGIRVAPGEPANLPKIDPGSVPRTAKDRSAHSASREGTP
jgi:hypothetical protein